MIREAGKEEVTSVGDTGLVGGRSRGKMQTVIANRPIVGLAALGGTPASAGHEVAGTEDFATLLPGEGQDDAVLEDPAVPDGPPPAGLTITGLWSGLPFSAGQGGDGVPDPTLSPAVRSDAILASSIDAVSVPVASDAGGLPAQPLAEGQGSAPTAADAQVPDGQKRTPSALGVAASGIDLSQAASDTADADPMARPAAEPSFQMPGPRSVVGQTPGYDPSLVALAAVGVRLWQGAIASIEDRSSVQGGPPAPASNTSADSPATALAVPGAGVVTSPVPPPLGPAPGLAETAILSLFAAQAEAAMLGPEGDGGGFSLPATSAALGTAPSAGGPAAAMPQLAAQLIHSLPQRSDGMTEIALSPDELGHVRVTLQTDSQNPDRMIVMLNFERAETLDLFRRHADQLAEALQDAGYSGVNIGFGQSYGNDSSGRADQPPGLPEPDRSDPNPSPPTPSLGLSGDRPALQPSGTLDLRI